MVGTDGYVLMFSIYTVGLIIYIMYTFFVGLNIKSYKNWFLLQMMLKLPTLFTDKHNRKQISKYTVDRSHTT